MAQVSYYHLTNSGAYINTADTTERANLLADGWTEVYSPTCGIYQNASDYTGLVALYRLKENSNGARYYTTDAAKRTTMLNSGLWTDEGTSGYVLPSTASEPAGWGPLHEAFNASTGFYDFTASATEWAGFGGNWVKSTTVFALVPSPHS